MTDRPEPMTLSFEQAVLHVQRGKGAAFAAAPVFGDDPEAAEGARVYVLVPDGQGDCVLRFLAGPFFTRGLAADETLTREEIPAYVRELRFMPTQFSEAWLEDQLQVIVSRLVRAAGIPAQMPEYPAAAPPKPPAEAVVPLHLVGRAPPKRTH
ncbi:MAG: hypothetical protein NZL99_09860 [Burkholderiaceae bacterium]|nr:hypothetical protein [Burkholderiaceae bacterium]